MSLNDTSCKAEKEHNITSMAYTYGDTFNTLFQTAFSLECCPILLDLIFIYRLQMTF